MSYTFDFLLVVIVLLNFLMLGTSRIRSVIRAAALQGIILGILPLFSHQHLNALLISVCVGAIVLKGTIIPMLLLRAMRNASIRREVRPSRAISGSKRCTSTCLPPIKFSVCISSLQNCAAPWRLTDRATTQWSLSPLRQ
jgi:hydrogenase-4 membrane subunit HyfE